jgi:hypothetical protein
MAGIKASYKGRKNKRYGISIMHGEWQDLGAEKELKRKGIEWQNLYFMKTCSCAVIYLKWHSCLDETSLKNHKLLIINQFTLII